MTDEQTATDIHTENSSRTVFLGNIVPGVLPRMIFDAIGRPGPIEALRILPDKRCAFLDFVNLEDAQAFLKTKKIVTLKEKLKDDQTVILAVKPASATKISNMVASAIKCGATRNIYLGGGFKGTEQELRKIVEDELGVQIDTVKVFEDRGIAFVHCISISQAIKAIGELEKKFPQLKLNYGDDRCFKRPPKRNQTNEEKSEDEEGEISADASSPLTRDNLNDARHKRTVFLSGIHSDATLEDLCDVIRGGNLESIRLLREKQTAFVSFVEAESAKSFYEHTNQRGFFIRGEAVKRIGWADIRILSSQILLALKRGATRVVYLGNLDSNAFSRDRLMEVGRAFGQVESVKFVRDKVNSAISLGFISFAELKDSITAVQVLSDEPEYKSCKVGYGKDRCSDPLPIGKPLGYNTFLSSAMSNSSSPANTQSSSFPPGFQPTDYSSGYTSIEDRSEIKRKRDDK
jgi:hypothetical protein